MSFIGRCGNVICGRIDAKQPFFTAAGSFWTNSTTKLLATTTEQERQARTRNRCNGEGYESVALVPLRHGSATLGLAQVYRVTAVEARNCVFSPMFSGVSEREAV